MDDSRLASKPLSPEVKADLVRDYHPLVCRVALKASRTPLGRLYGTDDDWIQEARIGLLDSAERFDPSRKVKFISYAMSRLWPIMLRVMDNSARLIHVPIVVQRCLKKDLPTKYRIEAERAFAVMSRVGIEDVDTEPADLEFEDDPDEIDVAKLLNALPSRLAKVVRLRFGIGGSRKLLLREVADKMGLSRQRVLQLEQDAIAFLREPAKR